MLKIVEGNLLEARTDALVNTVNTQGILGKGIALQFRRAFPEMEAAYREACRSGELKPGKVHVYDRQSLLSPRYIINFPTKRDWKQPSRISDIQSGLLDLVRVVGELGIRSIAIPPLGCGNGGLDWRDVRPLITDALSPMEDLQVFLYAPAPPPPAHLQVNRMKSPKLTPGRAALLGIMRRYMELDYAITMIEVQKLAYFLQEAGQPLRLQFVKHYYGPYADDLRKVLRHLEGHYILGSGDGANSPDTPIHLLASGIPLVESALDEAPETRERFDAVAQFIEGFETPYGMELLSTVHWVATKDTPPANSIQDAISKVKSWNHRKSKTMTDAHVHAAWERVMRFPLAARI